MSMRVILPAQAAAELSVVPVHPFPGEGQRRSPGFRLLRREQLVDRYPALLEGIGAAREIQPPDARDAFVGSRHRGVQLALESSTPKPERLRIVRAQALDIVHFEVLLAHVV